MNAEQAYETIVAPAWPKWPASWSQLTVEDQDVFSRFYDAVRGGGSGPARRGKLTAGTYAQARAVEWVEDTAGGKPVLRVRFDVPQEGGGTVRSPEWTCWLDEMWDKKKPDKPSPSLRGLLTLGVTMEDVAVWAAGGKLRGLDRNAAEIELAEDDNGYLKVQWVNSGPRDLAARNPLDAGARATVAQRMQAALALIKQRTPAAPPALCKGCNKVFDQCVCPPGLA